MGMFGKRLLNAIGAGLTGVDFAEMGRDRARAEERQKLIGDIGGLLMPGYTPGAAPQVGLGGEGNTDTWQYEAPQRTREPLNANSPDLASIAFKASQLGVPIDKLLDVLKTQQPDVRFDRGFGYNGKTGGAVGGFHPDVGEGRVAQMGPDGQPTGISNLPGYAQSVGEIERAKSQATESTRAAYDLVDVPMSDGSSVKVPRELALKLLGGAGQAPGGFGQSQTPAQAEAAKIQATTTTESAIGLPQAIATSQGALDLIGQLRKHPGLENRTGLTSVVPSIPGTAGADFDTMANQLKGKVFLEAFASLKGGGAITEREGEAATAAIARLNQRQTKEGYVSALADLERVVKAGMSRQQQKAGGQQRPATAKPAASLKAVPLADRLAEARRRGLIQ